MSCDPPQNPFAQLLAVAREVSFIRGAELVRQGEASRGAFLIRSGTAEARVALPGGGTLTVAEFRDGEMFGEMALIERGVCSATVVAQDSALTVAQQPSNRQAKERCRARLVQRVRKRPVPREYCAGSRVDCAARGTPRCHRVTRGGTRSRSCLPSREVSFIKGAELVRQGEASRGAFLITEPAPATDPLANVPRSRHTSLEAALHGQIFRAAGQ